MSKGGSSAGDSTVTQTDLPGYAKPYVKRLFKRGERESKRKYEPYKGERIAGPSGDLLSAEQQLTGMGSGITGLGTAQRQTGAAMRGADQYTDMGGGQFSQFGFGPTDRYGAGQAGGVVGSDLANAQGAFGGGQPQGYDFGDARQFDSAAAQQYMSPYMQNVVDVQKQQAQLDFDRAQSGRDAQAVQAGAFGGSRGAVQDALAQENLMRTQGQIQAQGQQSAYEDAQRMFGADREATMRREAERAGEFGRTQGMGMEDYYNMLAQRQAGRGLGFDVLGQQAAEGLTREQAQAGELGRVQGARDDSRFRAAEMGLGALGMQGDLAAQLADLGGMERQSELDYIDRLRQQGQEKMGRKQSRLDTRYQDFLAQQAYPQEQLQFFGDLVRGNIRGGTTSQQQFQQANPFKDLLGAGITGLSMSQMGG